MNNRTAGIVALIVVLLLLGLYLVNRRTAGTQTDTSTTTESSQSSSSLDDTDSNTLPSDEGTTSQASPSAATSNTASVKEFTVNGSNFSFSPSALSVNKGDTVRVIFKNTGGNHDFVIDEFDAATKVIGSGQQDTVEFVADKSGSFEYYCSVSNHREMGMKGTLIVN